MTRRTCISFVILCGLAAAAEPIDGRWRSDATVSTGEKKPYYLELKAEGAKITGAYIDIFGTRSAIRNGAWRGSQFSFEFDWTGDRPAVCKVTGELRDGVIHYEIAAERWKSKAVGRKE